MSDERPYKLTVQVTGYTQSPDGSVKVQSYLERSDYSDDDVVHTYKANVVESAVAKAVGEAFAAIGKTAGYATTVEDAIAMAGAGGGKKPA